MTCVDQLGERQICPSSSAIDAAAALEGTRKSSDSPIANVTEFEVAHMTSRRYIVQFGLFVGLVLQAGAALADDPATPAASPSPGASGVDSWNFAAIVNTWLDGLVQGVLSWWPSTPDAIKPSHILAGLMTQWPHAPWFLVGDTLTYGGTLFGIVATVKAFKLIWP